jgi:hypothetical protein
MRYRFIFLVAAVASLLAASYPILSAADDQTDSNAVNLQLEVDALSTLNDLNLTPNQLSALKGMIPDTAGTLSDAPTPISADYKAALKDARIALLGKDQDKIDDAQDKLADLQDKQDPDSDPDVDQSEAAK